ncbi:methylmalonyl-CoA mutase subunit beta [Neobacillus cucumis]|uniref:methylmalonyl-CoA mutase subunit beta n=1 Tax=Neobacillus cucumis TaxID=1740721 RepID=UPI002E24E590|nr:methylmalonyl-CoA mutase subunit beta [Neobacillus cucumis]
MDNLKNQSFSQRTEKDWQAKVEAFLKGKRIESLNRDTYENIVLKPLYTKKDQKPVPDYAGGSDYRRGIYPLGYLTNEWIVAQELSYESPEELKEKLHEVLKKGQTAIAFSISEDLMESTENLSSVLTGYYHQYPLAINIEGLSGEVLSILAKMAEQDNQAENVLGYIGSDPIALFAEEGVVSKEFIGEWKKTIIETNRRLPNLQTILINTETYHNGGANAVQELGIAIAEGVYFLDILQEDEMEIEQILAKMIFQFSIGNNFFMEIAKLRAARILWNRITELYGVTDEARKMIISAKTSTFTKSIFDPYVNLLRAGNEAFAAIIGGVQYLQVTPFDFLTHSTSSAERIARNTQLILKQESHLGTVIDPAGGSWYLEQLTNDLAEKAWEYFQKIEGQGGILNALKSGWLQQEINTVFEKRNLDLQTRKQSMIGTNFYADLNETQSNPLQSKRNHFLANRDYALSKIEAIPVRRLTEPFEKLRRKAKQLERKIGSTPTVGMICLGELKQHKQRMDFMKSFLAAGGVKAFESKPVFSIENAKQFILDMNTSHFCLCGTNEQYESEGKAILTSLTNEFPERIFYLAGLPELDKQAGWQEVGIKQFIHVNTNCYETLEEILADMEVNTVEETKA